MRSWLIVLKDTLLRWITHTATIVTVSDPAAHFRLVTLQSDTFKTRNSTPGDKIRVVMGGNHLRTYTPFDWDAAAGTVCLLAYRRGTGMASQWLDAACSGEPCQVLGPQRSTPLDTLQGPAVFIGDETSFALARALQTLDASVDVQFLFEVSSRVEAQPLLAQLGIDRPHLIERTADDLHLESLNLQLMNLMLSGKPRRFVFSGKSSTIQHLSRSLKRLGRSSSELLVKAYWAPGKQGLD